ncbi:MAG: HRDC domain-containing protein [Bacilli bacterium]|nr:HRDC domain-containing protein [Bacilli bacterium]
MPTFLIFNNYELDKIIELYPNSLDELKQSKILPPDKLKYHGEEIKKHNKNVEEVPPHIYYSSWRGALKKMLVK